MHRLIGLKPALVNRAVLTRNVLRDVLFHGEITTSYESSVLRSVKSVRSAPRIPKVFAPAGGLVVCEALRREIESIATLRFVKVEFERLYRLDFEAQDLSDLESDIIRQSRGRDIDFEKYLKKLPDVKAYHDTAGNYYMIDCLSVFENGENSKESTVSFKLCFPDEPPGFEQEISVRAWQLQTSPLLSVLSEYLIRSDLMEILRPFVDFRFFHATDEIEIIL